MREENIQKLSQLDRIEYRIRKKEIEDSYPSPFNDLILAILVFLGFTLLTISAFGVKESIHLIVVYANAIRIYIIVIIPLDIILLITNLIKSKKLDKEYFEVVSKKRRNK